MEIMLDLVPLHFLIKWSIAIDFFFKLFDMIYYHKISLHLIYKMKMNLLDLFYILPSCNYQFQFRNYQKHKWRICMKFSGYQNLLGIPILLQRSYMLHPNLITKTKFLFHGMNTLISCQVKFRKLMTIEGREFLIFVMFLERCVIEVTFPLRKNCFIQKTIS